MKDDFKLKNIILNQKNPLKKNRIFSKNSGFSLLESLFALFLVSFMVANLLPSLLSQKKLVSIQEKKNKISALRSKVINQIPSYGEIESQILKTQGSVTPICETKVFCYGDFFNEESNCTNDSDFDQEAKTIELTRKISIENRSDCTLNPFEILPKFKIQVIAKDQSNEDNGELFRFEMEKNPNHYPIRFFLKNQKIFTKTNIEAFSNLNFFGVTSFSVHPKNQSILLLKNNQILRYSNCQDLICNEGTGKSDDSTIETPSVNIFNLPDSSITSISMNYKSGTLYGYGNQKIYTLSLPKNPPEGKDENHSCESNPTAFPDSIGTCPKTCTGQNCVLTLTPRAFNLSQVPTERVKSFYVHPISGTLFFVFQDEESEWGPFYPNRSFLFINSPPELVPQIPFSFSAEGFTL